MSDKGVVVVIGATGPLGRECVFTLESSGYHVRAASRTVERSKQLFLDKVKDSSHLDFVRLDVLDKKSLLDVVQGSKAVVFCASAAAGWRIPGSSQNTPKLIDYTGAINVAEAVAQAKVPRYILVSSAMVTNKTSFPYLFLNSFFGRIMHWKRQGELGVIAVQGKNPQMSYTIIRPGHLINEPAKGPQHVVVDQGDRVSWKVTRTDVAKICCACLNVENTQNATFEVAGRKETPPNTSLPDTYEALLASVKPDKKSGSS
eukprot:jgi/Galph1/5724/GphlegSOOS_G4325.1